MARRLSRIPRLPALAGVATAVALFLSVLAFLHTQGVTANNCRRIELIETRIRSTITLSAKSLGKPGSIGYAYYRTHPSDLAKVRELNAAALRTFRADRC